MGDCGRYLVVSIREGCEPVNRLYYCDLKALPNGITGMLQEQNLFKFEYSPEIAVIKPLKFFSVYLSSNLCPSKQIKIEI